MDKELKITQESTPPRHVVFYALDQALLKSCSAALAAAGFDVKCSETANQVLDLLKCGQYDLFLVGALISEKERNHLAVLFRANNRGGKVIFLYNGSIRNAELADALLNARNEPNHLVDVVREQVDAIG